MKKQWWVCFLKIISLVFVAAVGGRMGTALLRNAELRAGFEDRRIGPYSEGRTMEEMNLTVLRQACGENALVWDDSFWYDEVITLPAALRYYARPGDAVTEIILQVGTQVITRGNDHYVMGYGICTFPTYDRGWRYAFPFREAGSGELSGSTLYYVRTEDIEEVCTAAIRQRGERLGWREEDMELLVEMAVLYTDQKLYDRGAYLSPDLTYPVLDRVNVLLLIAAGACAAGGAGLFLWEKKRRKVSA